MTANITPAQNNSQSNTDSKGNTMKNIKDYMNTPLTAKEIDSISDTLNVKQKGFAFIAKHMKDRLKDSPKTKNAIEKILKGSWSIVSFIVESFTIGLMSPAIFMAAIPLGVAFGMDNENIANKWVIGGSLAFGCIAYGALLALTPAGAMTSALTAVGIYASITLVYKAGSWIKNFFSKK